MWRGLNIHRTVLSCGQRSLELPSVPIGSGSDRGTVPNSLHLDVCVRVKARSEVKELWKCLFLTVPCAIFTCIVDRFQLALWFLTVAIVQVLSLFLQVDVGNLKVPTVDPFHPTLLFIGSFAWCHKDVS